MRIEQTVYDTLPAGQYRATVWEISETEGQWGPFAKFTFTIDEPDYQGVRVTAVGPRRRAPLAWRVDPAAGAA
jgi:hypothetical protein